MLCQLFAFSSPLIHFFQANQLEMNLACGSIYFGCHDFRRSWSLSLFGQRSAVDVTGLLAIAAPPFIFPFVLTCFQHTLITSPHDYYVYLDLCSLHVWGGYCLLSRVARFRLGCAEFDLYPWFVAAGTFVLACCILCCLTCSLGICFCDAVAFCSYYGLSKVLLCSLISALHKLHPPLDR